jgi:hypothetical protein
METKKEKIVFYIAVILFIVGIVCYAASSQLKPEDPVRYFYMSTAGNVLFDHKEHASEDGYDIDCTDCHHEYDEDENKRAAPCGECHKAEDTEDAMKRSEAFHANCAGCHEEGGSGPVTCAECHAL